MNKSIVAIAISACACSSGTNSTQLVEGLDPTLGSIALAITAPPAGRDVDSFEISIHAAPGSCQDPAIESVNLPLSATGSPGAVFSEELSDSHLFSGEILTLQPGQFIACAQPLTGDGLASEQCSAADQNFEVFEGQTTGVVMISSCGAQDVGAVSVGAVLNSAPQIEAIEASPSAFPSTCDNLSLTAVFGDPDEDPLQFNWTVLQAPPAASFTIDPVGDTLFFDTDTSGEYLVSVEATDPLGLSDTLTIPLFVSEGSVPCGVAPQPLTAAFVNGGFESGNLSGWVSQDLTDPLEVLEARLDQPSEGLFGLVTGFDGNGSPGNEEIFVAQDIDLSGSGPVGVSFDWEVPLCDNAGTQDRVFSVQVEPAGGGAPLLVNDIFVCAAGGFQSQPLVNDDLVDLSAVANQPVRIKFRWLVPETFTGPAQARLDDVRLIALP